MYGKQAGQKYTLVLSYEERLTSATTFVNGFIGSRVQGFVLETSEGQLFRAPGALFGEAYETNVHSVFLVGIRGSADSSGVHSLMLCMLDELDEVHIDMEYLSLPQGGISDVSVDNATLDDRQSERDGEIVVKNEEFVKTLRPLRKLGLSHWVSPSACQGKC